VTAGRARQSRLSDAVLLVHVPLKGVGMRVPVRTTVEIARVAVEPSQRQSKLVVRSIAVPQLQVIRQLQHPSERFRARRTRLRAAWIGVFRSEVANQLPEYNQPTNQHNQSLSRKITIYKNDHWLTMHRKK